jgi:hypothetical protein
MNRFLVIIILLSTSLAANAFPKLYLESGELLDMMNDMQADQKIPGTWKVPGGWKKELKSRIPEFQSAWDKNAIALSDASERISGRKFSRTEYSVALVLGPYLPMARPFLMNMQSYLVSSSQPGKVLPIEAFVMLSHHELLHHLLDNIEGDEFSKFSTLIQKYKIKDQNGFAVDSNENVLGHIHLMALQRAVYEQLGRQDLLKEAANGYLNVIQGSYAEAWKIVDKEGVKPFLDELQEFNHSKK